MADDDAIYRREEDRQWRDRTEERVVGLTSSEGVQNDRLEDLEEDLETLKEILEGKASDKDDNGMKGDLHDLAVGLNELHRLMAPDHLGQGGVIARLHTLEERAGLRERRTEYRWKFLTAITVAILSLAGLVLTNLDRIEPFFKRLVNEKITVSPPTKPHGGKTSKKRRKHPVAMEAPDGAPTEDVPGGRGGDGDGLQ